MDMAELVRLQLADLNELFEQKNMELEIFLPEKCPCMADSGLMAIAVRNILVNAVRYSPAGERISVKLSTDYNVDSSTSNSFLLKEVSGCQNSRELKSMKNTAKILLEVENTGAIGMNEFDNFLENNNLYDVIFEDKEYNHVLEAFRTARLSEQLRNNLRKYLQVMTKPLAVRSSGLFEDSLNQPFAGVYSTYLLPNNHPDIERRLEDVENAIKLVFASIYSPESRAYFNAIDYMIEEEKMAVIIQEVIGNEHNGRYYPEISGVAQSYNFYPFSYIQPEDGFAVTAIGLGPTSLGKRHTVSVLPIPNYN